ncbi:MAG: prepilin peptidase [Parvularculaceae bacterium]|nr:prepilin peptidase [Parvularculaceae bacterium]
MNFPQFPHPVLSLVALAGGLLIGSFLNVVIHRGPSLWGLVEGENRGTLVSPRSYCPACKAPIPASGLIPIVSFLLQRGRCRNCAAMISPRYPIVEALGGLVALTAVAASGWALAALALAAFGFSLLALAFIDLETGYLPDAITLPLIAAGLGANAFALFVPFTDAVIGAAAGYAALQGVALAYKRLRGRDGMGEGDAKLLAAIGAFGGWTILPFVVFAGAAGTLAVAILRKTAALNEPLPFGPGLCAAGFLVVIAARVFNVP